ncbi:MAG: AlpA family transcriptional regulator [Terracidiphilus sp.]
MILRLPAVRLRTGLSRSSSYLQIAHGTFPPPISLGARAVGWVESEVDDWIARKIAENRKVPSVNNRSLKLGHTTSETSGPITV